MTTITANSTIGINLNPASYTDPVVIGAGVTISNPGYPDGVYTAPSSTTFFVVQNDGAIIGANSIASGVGVYLTPGGSVTNAASASIAGYTGIEVSGGAGTVVNDGSILSGQFNSYSGNTTGIGVKLLAGGSVTNAAAASIAGGNYGVEITGGAGIVVNDGSIAGAGGSNNFSGVAFGIGVNLASGGSVTNAAAASITGGEFGVGGAGIVVNYGSIGGGFGGVVLSTGSVTNAASASITGYYRGIEIANPGTVVNYGSIAALANSSEGVLLDAGGSVTNAAGASITDGLAGVAISGVGTVVNSGYIAGRDAGVGVNGGSITNTASGTITGGGAYAIHMNGTLTNAGSVIGNGGTAVSFYGTSSNLLVLNPGFEFSGVVTGSPSASNTLELASAASAGTVTGLGTQILHFGSIVFDAGAEWSVAGVTRGLAGTISGFAAGDTIEVIGVTATGSSYANGILTLDEASGGSATLDVPGAFSLASFDVTDVAGGTGVSVAPCFRAGTRIRTAHGEVAVEDLQVGETVLAHAGDGPPALRPVAWIGRRSVDCLRHPHPALVWPVRVRAGAFGPEQPRRDLFLSRDHAVFVDGVLIPVRCLLNGATIAQVAVPAVTYFHVELAAHAVLLAENLPAESYLDTGNRAAFENAGALMTLHPDFASDDARHLRETRSCAPFAADAARLGVWRRLAARAVALGYELPEPDTTDDPDLRLKVDGREIRPLSVAGNRHVFVLPPGPGAVRLLSRAAAPCETRPWIDDRRPLGVKVRRIALRHDADVLTIPPDHPALADGWWAVERDGALGRWTDGDAALPVPPQTALTLEVEVGGTVAYVVDPIGEAPRRMANTAS